MFLQITNGRRRKKISEFYPTKQHKNFFFKSRKASYFIQTLVFNSERGNYNQVS